MLLGHLLPQKLNCEITLNYFLLLKLVDIEASLTLRNVTRPELIKVKNEKCDLFADFHSILATCRNHFSQLLNIHPVGV